ncbi:MAG: sodium:proton antiporter [Planctomycetaceae bacterium]|nr:sodium:proton antiporter [Planctomycetaceae bacterium]
MRYPSPCWGSRFVMALACLVAPTVLLAAEEAHGGPLPGVDLPHWTILPFAALLLCIAILPLVASHWWEHNRNKGLIAGLLSVTIVLYLVLTHGDAGVHELLHKVKEYLAFIALLGALYVISGGIYVQGSLSGTPLVNTGVLAFGAVIASFVGTTGASVLLIRPLLRANRPRQRKAHVVVFFIFIVSNCGGLLTPLGDPPLFLGFLAGVPFEWTFQLWKQWAFVNGILLVIFNVWDQTVLAREEKERAGSQLEEVQKHEPLRVFGLHNLLFLAGVVAVVYSSGRGLGYGGKQWPFGVAEGLLLALAVVSYFTTSRQIHTNNRFSFTPINEVAILFSGIFVTMTPALLILNANGDKLGVDEPWEFFWAAGTLSSFLDNAPTYLTFAATACGLNHISTTDARYLAEFLALPAASRAPEILAAISCGAVFMGANTYIGNGPNFMVKAIAEENGVKMPGFFGYMGYAVAILIPVFVAVTFVFFR